MHNVELVIYFNGEEVDRLWIDTFASRRAAKRAALDKHFRAIANRWPSRHSRAEAELHIGGREHRWLTSEFEEHRYTAETIGDRLRRGEAVAV